MTVARPNLRNPLVRYSVTVLVIFATIAVMLMLLERTAEALETLRERVRICRGLDDDELTLQDCLGDLAAFTLDAGDVDTAAGLMKEQEQLCRQAGLDDALVFCLGNQAELELDRADVEAAMALVEEQELISRQLRDADALAFCLEVKVRVLRTIGDHPAADLAEQELQELCDAGATD